jgi:serine/threonine-protein kinase
MAHACTHCGQVHPSSLQVCPVTGERIASFTLVNEDEVLVGSVVANRWHITEVLGQGTTGTVFGCEHVSFPRAAAIKILRPRYAAVDVIHRVFHGEARTAWTVHHPCLCEILDVGTLPDGAAFFVMERLEGETLAARILRERLSTGAAVDVVMQILSAIDAIHQRDLLLRDLHPQNVFLAARKGCRPMVKILDFGLARLVPLERVAEEWDTLRSVVGASDGTGTLGIPYYMSPERARGEHGVERESDLFVAMVILYEALTGQKPFDSLSYAGLMLQIASGRPPPLADARPDLPTELDALMARALSPNPRNRPATARDLQEEIRAVFDGSARANAGNRGSSALRAVPVAVPLPPVQLPPIVGPVSSVDSAAHTPQIVRAQPAFPVAVPPPPARYDEAFTAIVPAGHADDSVVSPAYNKHPPSESGNRAMPVAQLNALYEEETRTDRSLEDVTLRPTGNEGGDRARSLNAEASADSPHRTVRPPVAEEAIDIVIDEDSNTVDIPMTSRGDEAELEKAMAKAHREEEETETMQLTPELRARIEQMTREKAPGAVPPVSSSTTDHPPPTRRVGKP